MCVYAAVSSCVVGAMKTLMANGASKRQAETVCQGLSFINTAAAAFRRMLHTACTRPVVQDTHSQIMESVQRVGGEAHQSRYKCPDNTSLIGSQSDYKYCVVPFLTTRSYVCC